MLKCVRGFSVYKVHVVRDRRVTCCFEYVHSWMAFYTEHSAVDGWTVLCCAVLVSVGGTQEREEDGFYRRARVTEVNRPHYIGQVSGVPVAQ